MVIVRMGTPVLVVLADLLCRFDVSGSNANPVSPTLR